MCGRGLDRCVEVEVGGVAEADEELEALLAGGLEGALGDEGGGSGELDWGEGGGGGDVLAGEQDAGVLGARCGVGAFDVAQLVGRLGEDGGGEDGGDEREDAAEGHGGIRLTRVLTGGHATFWGVGRGSGRLMA